MDSSEIPPPDTAHRNRSGDTEGKSGEDKECVCEEDVGVSQQLHASFFLNTFLPVFNKIENGWPLDRVVMGMMVCRELHRCLRHSPAVELRVRKNWDTLAPARTQAQVLAKGLQQFALDPLCPTRVYLQAQVSRHKMPVARDSAAERASGAADSGHWSPAPVAQICLGLGGIHLSVTHSTLCPPQQVEGSKSPFAQNATFWATRGAKSDPFY